MVCTEGHIFVSFDPKERFKRLIAGNIELEMPERWEYVDDYGQKNGKYVSETNNLETQPQVGYVLIGNEKYRTGDKIFVHYLAYSQGVEVDVFGQTGRVIPVEDVFFRDNGEIEMAENTYLGKQLYHKIEQTPSGIYLGHIEQIKTCHVELLHTPKGGAHKPGEVIFTVDGAQYPVKYEGNVYVKVMDSEIVGSYEVQKLPA